MKLKISTAAMVLGIIAAQAATLIREAPVTLENGAPIALTWLSTALARFLRLRPPGASAPGLVLILLLGLAACTSSPTSLASQPDPDFEVLTGAGLASVSIRQPPPGITDTDYVECVKAAMERAAPGSVIDGPTTQSFPSQRIVWHVDLTASRGVSRLVVNVFNGSIPYAYEQRVVINSAPRAVISSAIESMSRQLLAVIAARANMPTQLSAQADIPNQRRL